MAGPLVSCIVPVHDAERYLVETLDSVFQQTHAPVEVIVVDDGSTDATAAVARAHPGGAKVVSQPQRGHAAARNRGVAQAMGSFVAFVDGDDLWDPAKLVRQLARFDEQPDLGVVFTHLENFLSPEIDGGAAAAPDPAPVPGYTSVTMLARREVFTRVGPLDESLAHGNDRDWFCRAAEAGIGLAMLPDVLVRRRLHGANRSAQHSARSRAEYLRILKRSLDRRRAAHEGAILEYPFANRREGKRPA